MTTTYKTRVRTGIKAVQFFKPADPPGLPAGTIVAYFVKSSGQLLDRSWIVPAVSKEDADVIMTDAEFNAKHEIETP